MADSNALESILAERTTLHTVKKIASEATDEVSMKQIIDLLHSEHKQIRWNIGWVMTHFSQEQVQALRKYQNQFIDFVLNCQESSIRRLILNVIEKQTIEEASIRTDFLDFCLNHMLAPHEPPGVQSLCMKLAYQQCRHYPELMHEFKEYLLSMENGYATSILGLRKKMLQKCG